MRKLTLLLCLTLALPCLRAAEILPEIGASFFLLDGGNLDGSPRPVSVDEPGEIAPFIALTYGLTDRIGLRFSYQYLNNVRTTAMFSSPPPGGPVTIPIVVWGHYVDDVHLLTLAPEFKWPVSPKMTLSVAPQLHWVASRGVVSYSTTNALIQLVAPRGRHADGFTAGGAARLGWTLGPRAAVSVAYQYCDLDPSFDREAHVFSGGFQWRF